MYYLKCSFFVVLFLAYQLSRAAVSEIPVVGVAEYTELGQQQFVVALNAEDFDLAQDQSFSLRGRQQINLRISADRLSPRKLLQFFIQGAAVNNSAESLKNNSVHMENFAAAVKGRLAKGDHLSLLYDGESQTAISVNDVELAEISSAEFFSMLLSVFTGEVPPSRDFKNAILGITESTDAKALYSELVAVPARKVAIRRWLNEAAPAGGEPPSQNQVIAPSPTSEAELMIPDLSPQTIEELVENQAQTDSEEPEVFGAADAGSESGADVSGAGVPLSGGKDRLNSAIQLAIRGSLSPALSVLEDEEEASLAPITAETILKSQRYSRQLLKLSQREIIYPRKALRLNQTGNVLARVIINSEGKLKRVSLVNRADHADLNSAVLRGIKKAQPFPPIPKELEAVEFSFVVPVVFKLE